jgi:uncharacterized protein (DUF1697 family)
VASLGFEDVRAFLASGNIVFRTSSRVSAVERRLSGGLRERLGYEVPTYVRSGDGLKNVVATEPFVGREASGRGKVQVAFLPKAPSPRAARMVLDMATDADWLKVDGTELFWWPKGGLSESDLDLGAIAKQVGPMTIRTLRTVERLVAKYF